MGNIDDKTAKLINDALETILLNRTYTPLQIEDASGELSNIVSTINQLAACVQQANGFVIDLSKGKLDLEPLPRSNYLASGAKQLHSHLNHLTWQTQQIAQGDYKQKVDFMGDFAAAFNMMTKQLKERETSLRAQNEIISTIFDHIECLFILNENNRIEALYINNIARQLFGIEETSNLLDYAKSPGFISQLIMLDIKESSNHELFDPDAKQWYNVTVSPLRWTDDSPALLFYCVNITHHKQRQDTLELDAHTDPLTGIYNRRALDVYIKRDVQHAKRLNMNISLLIIDIDFFKKYNDAYGHIQGDACLIAVAKCIQSTACRSTDFVARFGGEEFVALLPNTNDANALKLAEKVRLNVEALKIPNQSNPSEMTGVTVSVGVASLIPTSDTTPTQLLNMADVALYRSKEAGRNCVTLAN